MFSSLTTLWLLSMTMVAGAAPGADLLIDDAQLEAAGMFRYWQASLPIAKHDSVIEAHLVDDALYVITDDGSLFAIHADVGLIRWADKLAKEDYRIYQPSHMRTAEGTGPVIVPTTTRMFVYDRYSGDLLKSFVPEFAAGSPAVGFDGRLFVGSAGGRFYSLLLNHPRAPEPVVLWTVAADGPITAAPVLYDYNLLLFASQSGTVYSCRADDKALNWKFRTEGAILGSPTIDESGVYVASTDRSLYKLDRKVGKVLWRHRMPQPLRDTPVAVAHTVFQFCLGRGIIAVDADSGQEKWRCADARTFAAHTQDGDVLFAPDGRLLLVNHDTGTVRHTIRVPDAAGSAVNTRNDAVYVFARDGRVFCARLGEVPYLRRQQVLAAQARLNSPPRDEAAALRRGRDRTGQEVDPLANDPLRSRSDLEP